MLLEYPKSHFRRGEAWRDLLHNRPDYISEDGKHYFEVRHNGFRKQHTRDGWCWYVAKWSLRGEGILHEAPCEPPELDGAVGVTETQYVWDVWREYDGTVCCGFVLPHLVKSRCLVHDDGDCKICQGVRAWAPPDLGPPREMSCVPCKGSGEVDDPWSSIPEITIPCRDCRGEGVVTR